MGKNRGGRKNKKGNPPGAPGPQGAPQGKNKKGNPPEEDHPDLFYRRSLLLPKDAASMAHLHSTLDLLKTDKEKKEEHVGRILSGLRKGKAPMASSSQSQDGSLTLEKLMGEIGAVKVELTSLRVESGELKGEVARLNGKVDSLKVENNSLRTEVVSLRTEVVSLRTEVVSLRTEVVSLQRRVHCLETTVNSAEALSKRRFLETFRRIAMAFFPNRLLNADGDGPDPVWWNTTINDPAAAARITESFGQEFDVEALRLTRFDPNSLQREVNVMIHNYDITQAPEIYSTLVCQFEEGRTRAVMMKMYRVIFGREATDDAFAAPIGCCRCPIHCALPANDPGAGGDQQPATAAGALHPANAAGAEHPANAPGAVGAEQCPANAAGAGSC